MTTRRYIINYIFRGSDRRQPVRLVTNVNRTFNLVTKENATEFDDAGEAFDKAKAHGLVNFEVVPA